MRVITFSRNVYVLSAFSLDILSFLMTYKMSLLSTYYVALLLIHSQIFIQGPSMQPQKIVHISFFLQLISALLCKGNYD
jgi:hypothetical protein